ncbi:hypothetical protein OG407_25405 [Streptomyces sp. NBC_01515]|uniref:hypothetical protein n=1 Tax=Streptomyces sp. NBC_01515 TaxID=2903890 RepID=UPI00386AA9E6
MRPLLSSPFAAGLVALVLSETAYIAEIHHGGLLVAGTTWAEETPPVSAKRSNPADGCHLGSAGSVRRSAVLR